MRQLTAEYTQRKLDTWPEYKKYVVEKLKKSRPLVQIFALSITAMLFHARLTWAFGTTD